MKNGKVDKVLTDNKYFWTNAPNCNNYYDRQRTYSLATGMPMLNYNNLELQQLYIKFIQELKDCGVKGLRLDQAKHYALKEEGSNFFENVFGGFKNDMFIFGECIDTPRELLDKYVQNGINVFTDYNLPSDKSKAVISAESHDNFHTFKNTRHMNSNMLIREWEFLLSSNRESSMLWYCRPYDNTCFSEEIKRINNTYK
ncbi:MULTISPECIES: alpha-amylase family glycosyl hydrolase [unclassified Clostridium]|uniref:alpha-amylase family glycosyl hydrolase n=1 Tax=unclassified Clostridium TaxID=2614128 RepID=UPI002079AC5E|nr:MULTISPECIES: alpha-amylase family glycosyl hydrolase [unclassified Clostridium]